MTSDWETKVDSPTAYVRSHPVYGEIYATAGARGWYPYGREPGPAFCPSPLTREEAVAYIDERIEAIEGHSEAAIAWFLGSRAYRLETVVVGDMNPVRVFLTNMDANAEFGYTDDNGIDRAKAMRAAASFIRTFEVPI